MRVLLRGGWLFIVLVLFLTQCAKDKDIIAQVGSMKITITEFRKKLKKSYPHQNLKEIPLKDKQAILDQIVNFKKKVQAAYDLDLDKDQKVISAIQNQRDRMIGNKYYEKVIVDQLVTEEAIKNYLEKHRSADPTLNKSNDENELQIVKQKLYQVYSDSARSLWRNHYQELKKKYSYELQNENINKISTMISERIKEKNLNVESFTQEQLETELANWDSGSIELQDIFKKYGEGVTSVLPRFSNSKSLAREVDGQALLQVVLRDAKQYNIEDDKKIQEEMLTNLEAMLVHLVEKKEIEGKPVFSEDEVLEYYTNNPEKFIKQEEIEIWEIYIEDESLAKSILKKAKAGDDFSQLAKKYSQDKNYASKGGYLGYHNIKGRGAVSREAFKLGPGGKIGGPVKYRKGWIVLKTGAKNEQSIKSFDSVKKLAESYLRNERIAENRVQWEKKLNEKYPVKINYDKLKEI